MPKAAEDEIDGGVLDDPTEDEEGGEGDDEEAVGEDGEGQEAEEAQEASDDAPGHSGVAERPLTRGERRFQNLSRALKEQSDRADRLERQLQEQAAQRTQERRETPQEREARFALMSPEERVEARLAEATNGFQQQMAAMQIQQQVAQDLMAYQAKAAANPRMARYAGEVEQEFQKSLQKGSFVSREVLYHYLLGKKVDSQAPSAKRTQAANGKRAIQRQTTRPTNGRADVQATRRGGKTLEERLADVPI